MRIRALILSLATAAIGFAQQPVIGAGGIVNGASFAGGQPITGGSLISIFGTNLSLSRQHADTVPLSKSLGGVTVEFVNGNTTLQAPLFDSIPEAQQLNVQVPWDIVPPNSTQSVNVIVTRDNVRSAPAQVTVGPFSPGIFPVGTQAVAVNNADGSLAWPVGSFPGLTSHPAKPGDALIIYATGLGALDNPVGDGANSLDKLRFSQTKPTVLVGQVTAEVISSVLSPQFVGVYQVAIFVPNNAPTGDKVPLQIQMGGITSPSTVTIAVTR